MSRARALDAVRHDERIGAAFIGGISVPLPVQFGEEGGLKGVFPLQATGKHKARLAALSVAAGLPPGQLGELHLRLHRDVADADALELASSGKRGLLKRIASGRVSHLKSHSTRGHHGGDAATILHRMPPLAVGVAPNLDAYLHIDVVRARALVPMDRVSGHDPASWTSDPFVMAQLLPSGTMAAHVTTAVQKQTLCPQWDEELIIAVPPHGPTHVKLVVYDKDAVGSDDYMGEVVLPLPPRRPAGAPPLPPHEALPQGWHALSTCAEERERLASALRAMGRVSAAMALSQGRSSTSPGDAQGALGELYVRLSWGCGVRSNDVNLRPALRQPVGMLHVLVHEARGLPPRYADRPLVNVRYEHQQGTTPAAISTRDPVYPAEHSHFSFVVTEITSDIVFTVLDRDPVAGDQIVGEVCVPLPLMVAPTLGAALRALPSPAPAARALALAKRVGALLGVVPPPAPGDGHNNDAPRGGAHDITHKWAEILPRRAPGEALQRVRPRPERHLGALCYSAHLELTTSTVYAYAAPDVVPPEKPAGRDASADFSFAALSMSLGRMLDGIFMPIFAPCRTLLYLQSWRAPHLNITLITALSLLTLRFWFLARALTPLWVCLWPVFNGYVSYLIHMDDYIALCEEEAKEEAERRAEELGFPARRINMLWEAQQRAVTAAREAADPNSATAAAHAGVGTGGITGAIGSTLSFAGSFLGFSDGKDGAEDAAAQASAYKRIKMKLEHAHHLALYYADMFDTWCNLFTWKDRGLSAVVALCFTILGLVASAGLTAVALAAAALGLGVRHLVLVAGLSCFYPSPAAMRSFLEMTDYYLSYIPVTLTSQVGGSGLAATAGAEQSMRLSEAALRERIEAEAAVAAEKQIDAEETVKHARGQLRAVTFTFADFISCAWLPRMIARSPTAGRDTHMRMATRCTAATRPARNWLDRNNSLMPQVLQNSGVPPSTTTPLRQSSGVVDGLASASDASPTGASPTGAEAGTTAGPGAALYVGRTISGANLPSSPASARSSTGAGDDDDEEDRYSDASASSSIMPSVERTKTPQSTARSETLRQGASECEAASRASWSAEHI